jgi:hypothetical protein
MDVEPEPSGHPKRDLVSEPGVEAGILKRVERVAWKSACGRSDCDSGKTLGRTGPGESDYRDRLLGNGVERRARKEWNAMESGGWGLGGMEYICIHI